MLQFILQAVPLLGILRDLVERINSGQAGNVRKVVFSWASRSGGEFAILDEMILAAARNDKWLDLQLHISGTPLPALVEDKALAGGFTDPEGACPTPPAGAAGLLAKSGCPFAAPFNWSQKQ
ncbi:hypothetical protein WJX72_009865 [[Myrmecia] bisecta]|uniref:Uncharacterized protein n=1 Tax=[Myrmecia] bisecta TaxID=41462 RepID=A0AAW1PAA8_9CHLO